MTLPLESRAMALADITPAALPFAFVLLWSTGYIAAKLALPHCGPFTLVSLRFLFAAALLIPIVILWRAPWPRSWSAVGHIAVTGLLVNCVTLGAGPYALNWERLLPSSL